MQSLVLDGHSLSLSDIDVFLTEGARVSVSDAAWRRVRECASFCGHLAESDTPHYGINTGFGKFARTRVAPADAEALQLNLIRSHATAMGPALSDHTVLLMMLLRANSLVIGYSGVSEELVKLLVAMVNAGIAPVVPCYGSVGASGDLAPLAHVSLGLVGEGEVSVRGARMPARDALAKAGLKPARLRVKEGLALINGTQFMSAFAARDALRTRRLLKTAMAAAAPTLEAFLATDRVFDARLHELKRHPGQARVAAGFRKLVEGSAIVASHKDCDRVQDPYSFRCLPQVLGAVADTLAWVEIWIEREINSVTDNPVVFREQGDVVSGGNFHGEHMAIALDALAIAASEIASIAERRVDQIMHGNGDNVPRCLIRDPGLHSGFMIAQYLAAALVSENKVHAHPAAVDTIPTSMGFEDHVSMGSIGALKLSRVLDNVAKVISIELMCGAQALDFHQGVAPGRGTHVVHAAVRETVPFIEHDESLSPHLAGLEARVSSGEVLRRVESVVGDLLPTETR
jgi:histidine ammonia-lyase